MSADGFDVQKLAAPGMAFGGGFAVALVIATMPGVYLENIVGATGISELLSAAAPPLGNTARALLAIGAGFVTAALIYLVTAKNGEGKMATMAPNRAGSEPASGTGEGATGENSRRKGFKFPTLNLASLLPSRSGVRDFSDLPKLRRTDRHPDAPPRAPLRAEQDLSAPLTERIQPFDASNIAGLKSTNQPEPVAAETEKAPEGMPLPSVPARAVDEHRVDEAAEAKSSPQPVVPEAAFSPAHEQVATAFEQKSEQKQQSVGDSDEPLSEMSIEALVDRLAAGLERLQQLPSAPVGTDAAKLAALFEESKAAEIAPSQPTIAPVRPVETPPMEQPVGSVAADNADNDPMDAALKAALGTLDKLTANGRRAS